MFKRTQISTCALLALGGALMVPAFPSFAQDAQRIEVTGSRIKRAEAEGALPVTVIKREELEASGVVTVADFIRTTTFSSFGNFRPQSGSSAQGFSEANLRGLGSRRTLVMVDGRRVAKDPQVGDASDMNSIPLAAVERIEILTDGASAIYGSDAIGGVINVILRKDFEGVAATIGQTSTKIRGGDRTEGSAIMGASSDKGRVLAGVSVNSRDIIFQRDQFGGVARGASSFGNNYFTGPNATGTYLGRVPGCETLGNNFYVGAGNRCRYDFTSVAADEASVNNKSVFGRGEVKIAKDWDAYMTASVSRTNTFGRYAPVPGSIVVDPASPAHPWNAGFVGDPTALRTTIGPAQSVFLAHRFAAAGTRDTSTDRNLYDVLVGVKGQVAGFDIDLGARRTVSKFYEVGRGFVVQTLAEQAVQRGDYVVSNPFGASPATLAGFTATVGREGTWSQKEVYGSVTKDLFAMGGGNAALNIVGEGRSESYADLYDSLSEGGVVLGSAGNSAAGGRIVYAAGAELLLPISKQLEMTVAARYEDYSDYGNDFSPKVALRFQPIKTLTLRASAGRGFAAPTLPQLTQKPAFSADSIVDRQHCLADGNLPVFCDATPRPAFQINGLEISNPSLTSEKSKQFSLGAAWDITSNASIKADFWSITLDGTIAELDAQELVNRENGTSPLRIPAGLSVTRNPNGLINQVVRGSTNEGVLKTSGIDIEAEIRHKWPGIGSFGHTVRLSHVAKYEENGIDTIGDFGQPKNRITVTNNYSNGPFGVTWNINMIGKNGDDNVGFVGSYTTHDLQVSFQTPIKGLKVVAGAINAHNKNPQRVSDDTRPFNFDLYDQYGRQLYARVEAKF